jgi:MFS family permease
MTSSASDTPVRRPLRRTDDDAEALAAALVGLLSLAVAMGIGRFAFTPVLPAMLADAGLSVSGGAWLAAGNYAGYLAGALAAIRVSVDSGRAVVASTLAIGVFTLAMAWSDSFAAWFAWRTLAGVASAFALVHVSGWTATRIARHPALNGVIFAGVGSGIAASGLLCVVLPAWGAGSAQLWLALGVLALGIAAFCARRLARGARLPAAVAVVAPPAGASGTASPAATPAATSGTAGAPLPGAWRLIVCYGVSGFGYIVPATFLPVMARATIDAAWFPWVWPLFGLAAALSTWAVARFSAPANARLAWGVGQLVMAAGVVAVALFPSPATLFFAAASVGGTFVVITMAGFQVVRRETPSPAAARPLIAALTSAFAFGQIAGPVLVALVREQQAFFVPMLAAGIALASSVVLLARPRHARPVSLDFANPPAGASAHGKARPHQEPRR